MRYKESERGKSTRGVFQTVEALHSMSSAVPQIDDAIKRWLEPCSVQTFHAYAIRHARGPDLPRRIAKSR